MTPPDRRDPIAHLYAVCWNEVGAPGHVPWREHRKPRFWRPGWPPPRRRSWPKRLWKRIAKLFRHP